MLGHILQTDIMNLKMEMYLEMGRKRRMEMNFLMEDG